MPDGEGGGSRGGFTEKGVRDLYNQEKGIVDVPLQQRESQIAANYNESGNKAQAQRGGEFGLQTPREWGGDTSHLSGEESNNYGTGRLGFTPEKRTFFDRLFGRKKKK